MTCRVTDGRVVPMMTAVRRRQIFLLPLVVLVFLVGCGDDGVPVAPVSPSPVSFAVHTPIPVLPNLVILISIDTLRADHLGCYGYDRATSPAIDAFAEGATVFTQAVAQAPSTLPSHASMLTSLYPEHHGAFYARRTALAPGVVTLADVLADNGFTTAAFTGGGQLSPEFGLTRGFDLYDAHPSGPRFTNTVNSALQWLDQTAPAKAFLFLHTYEAHHPYKPSTELLNLFSPAYEGDLGDRISTKLLDSINRGEREIDAADLAHIIAAYDAEILSVDRAFESLQRGLEERGLLENTMLVLTSDHGEEFAEHGAVGWHSHTLFDELLLVPLVIRFPHGWGGGREVPYQVRSIDIAPTILNALGKDVPGSFEGVSLLPLLRGSAQDPELAALSQQDRVEEKRFVAVRHRSGKIIPRRLHASSMFADHGFFDKIALSLRPFMLFDVEEDPGEQNDLSWRKWGEIRRLRMLDELATDSRPVVAGPKVELESDTAERLRALGYIAD